jgi:flagellar assembly protein FliH
MNSSPLSSQNVAQLIEHLLNTRDPAFVNIRQILKNKIEEKNDFPVKTPNYEEFYDEKNTKKQFNEQELKIIELEKKVYELNLELKKITENNVIQINKAKTEGFNEGFNRGKEEGYKKAKEEFDLKLKEIQEKIISLLSQIEASKKEIFNNAHTILLNLCFEIAKRIIKSESQINKDVVLNVLKRSLSFISDREKIIIRVCKDELETVANRKDFWMPVSERFESITIEPDDRIEKGGCIIESNSGIVDARLGVQFEELKEIINDIWDKVLSSQQTIKQE